MNHKILNALATLCLTAYVAPALADAGLQSGASQGGANIVNNSQVNVSINNWSLAFWDKQGCGKNNMYLNYYQSGINIVSDQTVSLTAGTIASIAKDANINLGDVGCITFYPGYSIGQANLDSFGHSFGQTYNYVTNCSTGTCQVTTGAQNLLLN